MTTMHPASVLLNALIDGDDVAIGGQIYRLDNDLDLCLVGHHADTGEPMLFPTKIRLMDFISIGQKFQLVSGAGELN